MTNPQEPADGGYVLVKGSEHGFATYQRRDDWAHHNNLGEAHWFSRSDAHEPAITWTALTDLGSIAYVGEFVDRSGVNA